MNVIDPGSITIGLICLAFLGRIEDTGTRLHWLIPASSKALSKAFNLDVLLKPTPDTTKKFLKIIFIYTCEKGLKYHLNLINTLGDGFCLICGFWYKVRGIWM